MDPTRIKNTPRETLRLEQISGGFAYQYSCIDRMHFMYTMKITSNMLRNIQNCVQVCSEELKRPISNLQLQKILYYIQGAFLAEKGEPYFREPVLSWRYGPVVENEYRNYRTFISDEITPDSPYNPYPDFDEDMIYKDDKNIIQRICKVKSKRNGNQLINDTHAEAPWQKTHGDGSEMANDELKCFFSSAEGSQRLKI